MHAAHPRPFQDNDNDDSDDYLRNVRRRDEDANGNHQQHQEPQHRETILTPSAGARLTFAELQQHPAQAAPPETTFPTIHRAVLNPPDLQLLDQTGAVVVPNTPPDMIPHIHLMNQDETSTTTTGSGGYAMIRRLRRLRHAPGWGELWCGICFARVRPGVYRAPVPGNFVAIKKLNKRVVDAYLQHGSGKYEHRELRHVDNEYLQRVMSVGDRENPYKEMSRMEEIGDNIHVLQAIEFLQDDEFVYIIMPYARGRISLDTALFRRDKELSPQEARKLFIQILRICQYLEEKKIHHRDLSPDNFIFLEEDHLVVMDLAMSVQIPVDPQSGQRTLIHKLGRFGTPAFMSPEIYNNFALFDGVSCDLWSVMLILYAMLTNLPLYRRPDAAIDISYRFYVVAGAITQAPQNELVVEILNDVMDEEGDPEQQTNRHTLLQQSTAHLGLSPAALQLFHNFFRISPAERCTLAQVMESDYVRHPEE